MNPTLENIRRLLADASHADAVALLDQVFQPPVPIGPMAPPPQSGAATAMRELNPYAIVAVERGQFIAIERAWDCVEDDREYLLEFRSTLDGSKAVAFCLENPWDPQRVDAGVPVTVGHVFPDGLLCLGSDHARVPQQSPRNLRDTVLRARFWCFGFSMFKETGRFPDV